MRIQLLQPRHCYAPPDGEERYGHIYFPTGLYFAAARLRAAGVEVEVVDENLSQLEPCGDFLGVGVIGPPYIEAATAIHDREAVRAGGAGLIVGGPGTRGLSPSQFARVYGDETIDGNNDGELSRVLELDTRSLPSPDQVSIVDELARLSDEEFRLYFSREFSLYLSQGCRYSCTFCSAIRTRRNPATGALMVVRESYRQADLVVAEVQYMTQRAANCGIERLEIYLSNLDLFQSPDRLGDFVAGLEQIRRDEPSIEVACRGLATTQSFLQVHRSQPDLIKRFVETGLYRVGFGIDGATPEVWKGIRKPQNSDECLTSIPIASEVYGIQPEALMVFGHQGHDDSSSLALAVETTKRLAEDFGAIPRPHVAKDVIPGNDGWAAAENSGKVDYLLSQPSAFQMLDYTCLPSWLSHDDPAFRQRVTDAYLEICEMPDTLTQYVMPEDPRSTQEEMERIKKFNRCKYDI